MLILFKNPIPFKIFRLKSVKMCKCINFEYNLKQKAGTIKASAENVDAIKVSVP